MRHKLTRVVVTGTESTGKTTLARDLAAHFGVRWVAEQARSYAERIGRELAAADVGPIASAQIAAEDAAMAAAAGRNDRWLFLDTDLLSTVVYARHYYGACPSWVEDEARARRGDLYLLAALDIPWTPDSVRDRPLLRERLDDEFRATLEEFGATVCAVGGLDSARLQAALTCIEDLERAKPAK
jgi:NadR type nicotinamide-nucleotide adenylyltransferase